MQEIVSFMDIPSFMMKMKNVELESPGLLLSNNVFKYQQLCEVGENYLTVHCTNTLYWLQNWEGAWRCQAWKSCEVIIREVQKTYSTGNKQTQASGVLFIYRSSCVVKHVGEEKPFTQSSTAGCTRDITKNLLLVPLCTFGMLLGLWSPLQPTWFCVLIVLPCSILPPPALCFHPGNINHKAEDAEELSAWLKTWDRNLHKGQSCYHQQEWVNAWQFITVITACAHHFWNTE